MTTIGTKLEEFRKKINDRKAAKSLLENGLKAKKRLSRTIRREQKAAMDAQAIIQVVAQKTQDELRYQLSELPKLALSSVFDDPYDFEVEFVIKRGKTEVEFWFVREGVRINPKKNSGLGAVDIAGMALRPALWSLRTPRNRPTIWLDEPFKHLKGSEPNKRALAMLSEICQPKPDKNWPGLQIIMIADERAPREDILEVADKVFEFKIRDRRTIVNEI